VKQWKWDKGYKRKRRKLDQKGNQKVEQRKGDKGWAAGFSTPTLGTDGHKKVKRKRRRPSWDGGRLKQNKRKREEEKRLVAGQMKQQFSTCWREKKQKEKNQNRNRNKK
jgi:hypothetical protein